MGPVNVTVHCFWPNETVKPLLDNRLANFLCNWDRPSWAH